MEMYSGIISGNETSYYNTFSKYVLTNTMSEPAEAESPIITYETYQTQTPCLEKYKLGELKTVAKHYHLHVSGNKPVIVDRIRGFFTRTRCAIRIQAQFRLHLVRMSIRLRGPALLKRNMCVNDCDFYSLDPLSQIPNHQFFSFVDEKEFVYGFDIFSLVTLMKKTNKIINPYNRNPIPNDAFTALLGLYKITRILFPDLISGRDVPIPLIKRTLPTAPIRRMVTPDVSNQLVVQSAEPFGEPLPTETIVRNSLQAVQAQPMDTRIRELFMEINLLGNYAESRWFTDLDRLRLARFYSFYYDWWSTRSRLPPEVKRQICVVGDPFIHIRLIYVYPTTTMEEYREACLSLMEHMIYGGVDTEYRKLGALQLLSILTVVSFPARNSMPWLYESILV